MGFKRTGLVALSGALAACLAIAILALTTGTPSSTAGGGPPRVRTALTGMKRSRIHSYHTLTMHALARSSPRSASRQEAANQEVAIPGGSKVTEPTTSAANQVGVTKSVE
jgi:hypothetical protein